MHLAKYTIYIEFCGWHKITNDQSTHTAGGQLINRALFPRRDSLHLL